MCYHNLSIREPGRLAPKLELQPEYPQQPSLLMRGNGSEQEQPLKFLEQADGYDYFNPRPDRAPAVRIRPAGDPAQPESLDHPQGRGARPIAAQLVSLSTAGAAALDD